jgi:hypothetical protein
MWIQSFCEETVMERTPIGNVDECIRGIMLKGADWTFGML